MEISRTNGIMCEWSADLIDAKSGEVVQHVPFHKNTILNSGMSFLINQSFTDHAGLFQPNTSVIAGYYNSIGVGSGTNAPAFTDTVLQTFVLAKAVDPTIASVNLDLNNNNTPLIFTMVTTFVEAEANGTIAEMGLLNGTTNTAGKYFCRNRLVDVNGNPTTITKDSGHILRVTARITITRFSDPFASVPITESGNLGTANTVVSFVNNQWLADILLNGDTANTGGAYVKSTATAYASTSTLSFASAIADTDYTDLTTPVNGTVNITKPTTGTIGNDYYQDTTYEFPLNVCNINIKSLVIDDPSKAVCSLAGIGHPGIVCQFATPLPKDATNKVYLTFRHVWSRS